MPDKTKTNPFDIENQFDEYLSMVNIKKENMSDIQLQEIRRAYYGACGQLLVLLKDRVSALPELVAIAAMEDLNYQVAQFWTAESQL